MMGPPTHVPPAATLGRTLEDDDRRRPPCKQVGIPVHRVGLSEVLAWFEHDRLDAELDRSLRQRHPRRPSPARARIDEHDGTSRRLRSPAEILPPALDRGHVVPVVRRSVQVALPGGRHALPRSGRRPISRVIGAKPAREGSDHALAGHRIIRS